jgi:hypothetical protein
VENIVIRNPFYLVGCMYRSVFAFGLGNARSQVAPGSQKGCPFVNDRVNQRMHTVGSIR